MKKSTGTIDETHEITVRIFLVRHGETEANRQKLVVGQSDSPLTTTGIEQAKSLSKDPRIRETLFWRVYSSDLKRTQRTTALVLDLDIQDMDDAISNEERYFRKEENLDINDCSRIMMVETSYTPFLKASNVILDKRIREIAKGARQGLPKTMSLAESIEERKKLGMKSEEYPLRETEDDGWLRASSWLTDVIVDAINDTKDAEAKTLASSKIDTSKIDRQRKANRVNVLVIGHSGIFRAFLTRILGHERLRAHPDSQYDPIDGRFFLPNTSLTILDLHVIADIKYLSTLNVEEGKAPLSELFLPKDDQSSCSENGFGLRIDIIELTSTEHYEK